MTPLNPFGRTAAAARATLATRRTCSRICSPEPRACSDGTPATAVHGSTRHGATRHGSTRHGSTRHGATRHGSTRHGSTRHGACAATGAVSPSERHAQPEVLVLDSAPDVTSSPDDGETRDSFDDDPTATASFSVDLDENVDDASISFAARVRALEPCDDDDDDDDDGDGEVSFEDERLASPSASPRPRGAAPSVVGGCRSARPRAAVGASRPSSARGGARARWGPRSGGEARSGVRLGGDGEDADLGNGGAGAAPWAGALDGSGAGRLGAFRDCSLVRRDGRVRVRVDAVRRRRGLRDVRHARDDGRRRAGGDGRRRDRGGVRRRRRARRGDRPRREARRREARRRESRRREARE